MADISTSRNNPYYAPPTNQSGSPFNAIYDLEYFSGSQVFIYIGDIWVDEVTSLQYETRQNKIPIYGYASQLFDRTAAGQVIVQGSFTINFKEQGYLLAVLDNYSVLNSLVKTNPVTGKIDEVNVQQQNQRQLKHQLLTDTQNTIEQLFAGKKSIDEKYKDYASLAGNVKFDVNNPGAQGFNDIMKTFEDQVWGKQGMTQDVNQGRRADDNQWDGFDIYVVFGNYQSATANHTVQKISGVRILSQSKIVQIDGRPVQEQYDFIARTVI